jgi:hypothetical protein
MLERSKRPAAPTLPALHGVQPHGPSPQRGSRAENIWHPSRSVKIYTDGVFPEFPEGHPSQE